MAYFVTGGTGFIGRRLVQHLLSHRQGKIHVLVREGSTARLDELIGRWRVEVGPSAAARIVPVLGDLRRPLLGVGEEQVAELRGQVKHFFHLAAVYDMTAPTERNAAANVGGTTHVVELARALEAGCLHHVSSVAVAGYYRGTFTEEMFDEGQKLPSPYHRDEVRRRSGSCASSRPCRGGCTGPAVVVGDSRTGEMDKVDGPYYFFKPIRVRASWCRNGCRSLGPDLGATNVVPVDYVAAAMEHLVHEPELDGRAFHLANPEPQRVDELINELATAAHAPRVGLTIDKRLTDPLPTWPLKLALGLPPWRQLWRLDAARARDPAGGPPAHGAAAGVRQPRDAAALAGIGIERRRRCGTTRRCCGATGRRTWTPTCSRDRDAGGGGARQARGDHRRVLGDRARDGAAGRRGRRRAAAGGAQRREARGGAHGDRGGGRRGVGVRVRHPDMESVDTPGEAAARRPRARRHARQQRGPLDPPLDRALLRPLPRLRAHDGAQLLRRDPADPRAAAAHARARLRAHRQRLVDRRADEPAAVLRLRRVEGRAGRVHARRGRRRRSATASRSRPSTCRWCARR